MSNNKETLKNSNYEEAVKVVRKENRASVSLLQRRLKIGYIAASRLIDKMENEGVIGEARGAKPRKVLKGSKATNQEPNKEEWTQEDVEKLIRKKDSNCRRYLKEERESIKMNIEVQIEELKKERDKLLEISKEPDIRKEANTILEKYEGQIEVLQDILREI